MNSLARLWVAWGRVSIVLLLSVPGILCAQESGVESELVVSGLTQPIGIENAGDGSDRLFIIEKAGRIRIVRNGTLQTQPFLDVTGRVSTDSERGLLGLAFHPGFASNGEFYIHYTEDTAGDTVLEKCSVDASSPDTGNCNSEDIIFTLTQTAANHNGGKITFGPDGYLYVSLGDGGGSGNRENAQDLNDLHGKILRLDIGGDDFTDDPESDYAIPPDNPFVGQAGANEIWAFGLRNPWRLSFDRMTGDLWIGDVGQQDWEEIDFQAANDPGGHNYGWAVLEGEHCFNDDPPGACNDFLTGGSTLPVAEIDSSGTGNCSITGGYRYRGTAQPKLFGYYLFADYCSGRIWGLLPDCNGDWILRQLHDTGNRITSFGEDEAGEIYYVDISNGSLYRVVVAAGSGGPALDPSPGSLDYTASPQTLATEYFNNGTGTDDAVIEAFALSDADHFTLDTSGGTSPCGATPVCLAAGESCTVEATFAPQREGGFDEFLTFLANSAPAPVGLTAELACTEADNRLIENQTVSGTEFLYACETIAGGDGFAVADGGRAELRAGVSVALQPGATVATGGSLSLVVDPVLAQP